MLKRSRSSFSTDATHRLYHRIAATDLVSQQAYESLLKFFNTVRERLSNHPEKLFQFQSVSTSITSCFKTADDPTTPLHYPPVDAPDRLKALLQGHSDDLIALFDSIELVQKQNYFQGALDFLNQFRQHINFSDTYPLLLKRFHSYSVGEIDIDRLNAIVTVLIGHHPSLFEQWKYYLDAGREWSPKRKRCQPINPEPEPPITIDHEPELPVDNDPEPSMDTTPSYKVIELKNDLDDDAGQIEAEVLNHVCVLRCPGDDTCFKTRKLGRDENDKFLWEDKRFEADMLKERLVEGTKYLEARTNDKAYLDEIGQGHLLQAISHLYGRKEEEVLDNYHTNPDQVMPRIIKRMKEKQEELKLHIRDHIDVGMRKAFRK